MIKDVIQVDPITIYILVGIFTPGPNNIISSSSSSKIGFLKTLPFMFGVLVGTFSVFFFSGMFYAILTDNITVIVKYIGYVGAVYITYLAVRILSSDALNKENDIGTKHLFVKAILLTHVNPKAIIFGITVMGLYFRWGLNIFDLIYISEC